MNTMHALNAQRSKASLNAVPPSRLGVNTLQLVGQLSSIEINDVVTYRQGNGAVRSKLKNLKFSKMCSLSRL